MFYRPHNRVTYPRDGKTVGEMMTKQSHKQECDIHTILRQFQRTGILTHVARAQPLFDELPDGLDFQAAMHQVLAAQEAFAAMPAKVRDRFGNDPARLLAALQAPEMRGELEELGILQKPSVAPLGGSAPTADGG